jgi:hypothetical protein
MLAAGNPFCSFLIEQAGDPAAGIKKEKKNIVEE